MAERAASQPFSAPPAALSGRVILITGAGRGLGAAFAAACGRAGASVIVADINPQWGEATAALLVGAGVQAFFMPLDVADSTSVDQFASELARRCNSIDGLVNNAALATGIGGKTFEEIDVETWDRVMAINVRGPWLMTRAMAPLLRRSQRGGRVLNIASDTALWGAPRLLHYVASKGAVISMTRALSRELGVDGITVNALAPGLVRVEATEYVPEERKQLYVQGAAIQRPQVPEDTVGAAVFLLSDGAAFISGQILPINGGFISA
jgi:NAD(P)-dependent dehydrogenase (short-subunit alcohol dehydrogenase family)